MALAVILSASDGSYVDQNTFQLCIRVALSGPGAPDNPRVTEDVTVDVLLASSDVQTKNSIADATRAWALTHGVVLGAGDIVMLPSATRI